MDHNDSNSFLSVNATKIFQFKARGSEIKKYPLCLGNISKDFSANKIKKQIFPLSEVFMRENIVAIIVFCTLVCVFVGWFWLIYVSVGSKSFRKKK